MKVILLTTIILTIAPVWGHGGFSSGNNKNSKLPCQDKSHETAYDMFKHKHIVRDRFDRTSKKKWAEYLKKNGLCGRTPIQSFFEPQDEESIKQICKQSGQRLKADKRVPGNLCISMNKIMMYNVKSSTTKKGDCKVKVKRGSQFVVVACNKVQNNCRPVHFEKYQKKFKPDGTRCQTVTRCVGGSPGAALCE